MNALGRVARAAGGDVRDRVRRPVYAVVLLAAVGLAYLALPSPETRWTVIDLAGYRGVYGSAYVGAATAFAGALWLTIGGFYVVRGTIARDARSGVGELLAATPLRTWGYLLAKFAANVAILGSMLLVLAGTGLVVQLVRGESRVVDPVALLQPFVVVALPVVVLTAALAVLFDTVPGLRGGFGNVVWFVVSMIAVIGGQSEGAPLGGLGSGPVFASLREALAAEGARVSTAEFSFGFTSTDAALIPVPWDGFTVSASFALQRATLAALAVCVAVLPALWFNRFDPAATRRHRRSTSPRSATPPGTAPHPGPHPAPYPPAHATSHPSAHAMPHPSPYAAPHPPPHAAMSAVAVSAVAVSAVAVSAEPIRLPVGPIRPGAAGLRLVRGELRILVQGLSRWWWVVAAGLALVPLPVPQQAVPGFLLAVWIWPVLVWSRLGTQRIEQDVDDLLRAYPRPRRRLLAEWAAGVALTTILAAGPLLRLAIAGDGAGLAAAMAGALFVPSLAFALGTVSRSHRLFQAVYPPLWYFIVNGVEAVDVLGALRTAGTPAGPPPAVVTTLAIALLLLAILITEARTEGRLRLPRRRRTAAHQATDAQDPTAR